MKAFRVANGILVIQRNQSVSVLGRSFTPSTGHWAEAQTSEQSAVHETTAAVCSGAAAPPTATVGRDCTRAHPTTPSAKNAAACTRPQTYYCYLSPHSISQMTA